MKTNRKLRVTIHRYSNTIFFVMKTFMQEYLIHRSHSSKTVSFVFLNFLFLVSKKSKRSFPQKNETSTKKVYYELWGIVKLMNNAYVYLFLHSFLPDTMIRICILCVELLLLETTNHWLSVITLCYTLLHVVPL